MAESSLSVSVVRSATISALLSKLSTMALSWLVRMASFRNSPAASCSKRKRSRMLLLVSIRMPRRRGRSDSAANSWMTCGCLRSEEHTSELQSLRHLVCRLLLEKKHKDLEQSLTDARHEPALLYMADGHAP